MMFEGTVDEILSIYRKITVKNSKEQINEEKASFTIQRSSEDNTQKFIIIPKLAKLIEYIEMKRNFKHDILSVEEHFFKKRISSRKNPQIYRLLSLRLIKARKKIEIRYGGKFESTLNNAKNLKSYSFKKN